jgi:hypothetical protein
MKSRTQFSKHLFIEEEKEDTAPVVDDKEFC